ncbi:hypothetical protein GOZ97_20820 [Agrobacterium vitis]|uniref:hypothetical protein n=1 Tax=Rhizobium/Agrobacterium group TaxID=227290 RepID=UPI0008FAF6E6|nr:MULTISPECIES: hypothetical protein [Rhizobium/Agrobacterium group]MCF1464782.1 hypothetical protein [Allorhizobium ampelinum]MCF1495328.1 hypothetical protein [Allorhizobium ampelinum]MUZ54193.1 hypothetical protein [Agrobacterium vitis]MUZ93876.1 hypothetical protein [Agrobacterium vitis]MVA41982.1 hypothetical protein [Agrobacterium vitis]
MPITDPSHYRDRTEDWSGYFNQRRKDIIRKMVTPELIAEHERNPRGNGDSHSRDLSEVLRYIRNIPSSGKIFIYAVKPFREYRLARMGGPGITTELMGNETFSNENDAAHAVFSARLQELDLWTQMTVKDIVS